MIRAVWLTAACLVVLGAMAAGKVAKAPAADEKTVAGATVDADLAREPLIRADRLKVTYMRQEKPSESTLQPIDPNAINSSAANSKRTAKKGKPAADSRDSHVVGSFQAKRAD